MSDNIGKFKERIEYLEKELEKYNYKILNILDISTKLASIKETDKLIKTIVMTCRGLVQSKAIIIFIKNNETELFEFSDKRLLKNTDLDKLEIESNSKLNSFLLTIDTFAEYKDFKSINVTDEDTQKILDSFNLKYLIPLYYKNNPTGFMFISDRFDNNEYTKNDFEILSIIGNQTILSIENNRLLNNALNSKKQLEKSYNELKKIDKMKDDFMSLISHELYTPLTVMLGALEGLEINIPDEDEENKVYVEAITESTADLKDMVDKILLSSKLLAEKIEFKFSEIDINKLILESINYNKKYADKKGVNIKFNSIKNFPLVKADKKYLKIVLDYIINNAIKFSDNKKENKYVEIKISQFENRCIISIEDNGIGIEKENLDKIFLKFEHNEDLMAHSKGMGLSLPICKEIIVYGHNNKIWCESEKNKGSVFYFSVDIQFVS